MPLDSVSKLLGHAQVSTTQIYTAGADPHLAHAYEQAMHHSTLSTVAPDAVTPQSLSAPVDTTIATPAPPELPDWAAWGTHLAPAVRQASLNFVQSRLGHWKPQRRRHRALQILGELRRFWDWLTIRRPGCNLAEVQLGDLHTYRSERIAKGCVAKTPDVTLSYVVALLRYLTDQGQAVDASVFRLRPLPRPVSLPRHLSDGERQRLEQYVQQRLTAATPTERLENACFFVLAHGGLRAGECVELQFQDCDLLGRRMLIRQGKGLRDRLVYLSDTACTAIRHYLAGWARTPTAPLFTHPDGRPISYEWLWACIGKLGDAAGVSGVTPHRLRHTLATRLLNAGMDITQIQKLLGHQHLDTTMIYARVLDTTLEAQYRRAMTEIERQQSPLSATPIAVDWPAPAYAASGQPITTQDNRLDNSV